ncbi:hypothetical protein KC711_02060 [Candidatus Peregrinibacteria bacterium]|nr:hypothetical protein [Candidatus Peregrinibacteria bacterium]
MSPFLYDPTPYNSIQITPNDIIYAIIPLVFIIIGIIVMLRFFLYREQKVQEMIKMNKKRTLKSLIIMKDLEDELEKEMSDAIIARAIRSRPS